MRILIATGIYPPDAGGPASLTESLLRHWTALGHAVHVVSYGDTPDQSNITRISRRMPLPLRYVAFAYRVWRQAKHADVLLVQGAVSEGLPATIAASLRRIPTVLRVPGDYAWEMFRGNPETSELLDDFVKRRHGGKIYLLEKIERWVAARANSIITPSRYLKDIVSAWGMPSEKIRVILNTVNPFDDADHENVRQAAGLEGKRILLCAARAVPWKRVDFLLRVLARLPKDIVFVLAGDGPMLDRWKALAEQIGVGDRTVFLGRVRRGELANWYRSADAFVLASSYEGYPFVVAEAVSFGLPCFVSDKAGNPETKEQYPQHVTVLPWNDEAAWRSALETDFAKLPRVKNKEFSTMADEILNVLKSYARIDA